MQIETRFVITVDGKSYEVDPKKECAIDEQDLNKEFVMHPSRYAWFAAIAALYEGKVSEVKFSLDILEAQLDRKYRDLPKKQSEKEVYSNVLRDEVYVEKTKEYQDVKTVSKMLNAIVRALEVKRDMLVQLGGMRKREMDLEGFSQR